MKVLHSLDPASQQQHRPVPAPPLQSMSAADRHHLANEQARSQPAEVLFEQRASSGADTMDAAVAAHAPPHVVEEYQALVNAASKEVAQTQTASGTGEVSGVDMDPTVELEQKLEAQQEAQQAVDDYESGLARELAAVGPLDETQHEAFCENYKAEKDAQPLYDALDEANAELATHLEENQEVLLQQAQNDRDAAAHIYDSLEALADSEHSGLVVSLVDTICATKGSALDQAFAAQGDLVADVLPVALGAQYTQMLADNGFDTEAAFAEFMLLVGSLKGHYSDTKQFADGIELLAELANGNWDALDTYGQGASGSDMGSKVFNLFMSVGSLVVLVNSAGTESETYALEVIQKTLDTGKVTADMIASHLQSLAKSADDLAPGTQALKALGKAMGVTAALLGAVISTMQLDDPNAGDGIALAGKYLQTFGAVLAAIPGGQAAGLIMAIGGSILETGGEIISTEIEVEQRTQALIAAGVDPAIAPMMARHGPELSAMAQSLDLTPEQAQDLLLSNPEISAHKGTIAAFTAAAEACDMSGDLVLEFAHALKDGSASYMDTIFSAWSSGAIGGLRTNTLASHLRETIAIGVDGMQEFLIENSDAYTAEAQSREQARSDFENAPLGGFEYVDRQHAANLNNNPTPAYQAEYAALIVEGRGLDYFIDGVLRSGEADHTQTARDVVDEAEAQGLITAQEAEAARDRLDR